MGKDAGQPSVDRLVVGWREYVALPQWGIASIRAKIDTGARTSAVHVENVEALPGNRVRFEVVHQRGDANSWVPVEAEIVRESRVRPSTGRRQCRYVVATTLRLGPVEKTIELSLVSRKKMLCRLLLGRTALDDGFLVDPGRTHILGVPERRRRRGRARGRTAG